MKMQAYFTLRRQCNAMLGKISVIIAWNAF
jgi:hypothetical protein